MMTAEPTPTPSTVRRQDTINEAIIAAERLVSVLRGYRAAKRDGFPMAHLARIDAVLERTSTQVRPMLADQRDFLIRVGAADDEIERFSRAVPIRARTNARPLIDPTPPFGVASVLATPPDDTLDVPQSTAGDCN